MTPRLILEPLEERMLPSGSTASLLMDFHTDPTEDTARFRLLLEDDDSRRREDSSQDRPHVERAAAELLVSLVLSGMAAKGYENRNAGPQGNAFPETPLAFSDPFPAGSVTLGQSSPPSATAWTESPLSLDLSSSADGTAELAVPGPFSDSMILDAWHGGLPRPETELVPVAEKDLTIVAAYLVGTPPPLRTADGAATRTTEFGLTDFIVGNQDSRSDRPVLRTPERGTDVPPRAAREQWPIVPDRVPIMPSRRDVGPADPDTCDVAPCEEGRGAGDEPQGTGPEEGQ